VLGSSSWESVRRNPNQVYTRDALITLPWEPAYYTRGQMKAEIRRPESDVMEAAVKALGLRELVHLLEGLLLEGGDVIPFGREGRR